MVCYAFCWFWDLSHNSVYVVSPYRLLTVGVASLVMDCLPDDSVFMLCKWLIISDQVNPFTPTILTSVACQCLIVLSYVLYTHIHRNLVSASQDGKLIVWDGHTTNKVLSTQCTIL